MQRDTCTHLVEREDGLSLLQAGINGGKRCVYRNIEREAIAGWVGAGFHLTDPDLRTKASNSILGFPAPVSVIFSFFLSCCVGLFCPHQG